MRTTINVDDQLLREAKIIAASSGKTLTQVFEDSLRESFARRRASKTRKPIKLHTVGGQGLQPGVDGSTYSSLLNAADAYDARTRR